VRKVFAFLVLLALTACASPTPSGGISPEGHYYLGPKNAKVLIEEYTDFQ
jgi:uncharacterized lipoprotein YmbA